MSAAKVMSAESIATLVLKRFLLRIKVLELPIA
jgi:hypothetical protein